MASNGNPLDDITRHSPPAAVVEAGRAGIGVAGKILHIGKGHALRQEIRYRSDPTRVGRKPSSAGRHRGGGA